MHVTTAPVFPPSGIVACLVITHRRGQPARGEIQEIGRAVFPSAARLSCVLGTGRAVFR